MTEKDPGTNYVFTIGHIRKPLDFDELQRVINDTVRGECERIQLIPKSERSARINVWGLPTTSEPEIQRILEIAAGANQFGTSTLKEGVQPDSLSDEEVLV